MLFKKIKYKQTLITFAINAVQQVLVFLIIIPKRQIRVPLNLERQLPKIHIAARNDYPNFFSFEKGLIFQNRR